MSSFHQQQKRQGALPLTTERFRAGVPISPPVRRELSIVEQSMIDGFDWTVERAALSAVITPEIALEWLKRNARNRHISQRVVTQYGCDMIDGRFQVNGQPIIFSSIGNLHDGQHRLTACVEAKVSFVSDVRFGANPDSFSVLDLGRKRGLADLAELGNIKNYVRVSAAAGLLWTIKTHGAKAIADGFKRPTPTQAQQFMWENRESLEAASELVGGQMRLGPPSILCAAAFLFSAQNADRAVAFFADMKTAIGLSETNPVRFLLKRLMDNRASKAKLPGHIIFALMCKAWIYYRDGREMKHLSWRTDGAKPEPFPEI